MVSIQSSRYTIIGSPLTGFGGKSTACKQFGLHEFIPICGSSTVFIELFAFTCVMFFNITSKIAVINDKYDAIWNFWNVIKNNYSEFENELKDVWIGSKWFKEYALRTDPVGRAVYLYLQSRGSHKGIIEEKFRYKFFNHPLRKNLQQWHDKLDAMNSLSIWDLDFREVFQKLEGKGTESYDFVWYQDPPYVDDNRYVHNFTEQDHRDLAMWNNRLRKDTRHHIILSYNDHPLVRELYRDWYCMEVSWHAGSNNDTKYTELLLSNRPLKRYRHKKEKTTKPTNILDF